MENQEHKFRKNQRVKLKSDGQDALYAMAGAGSPGWVRKLDKDNMGYPTIFIEWDKDHWSYNGEPDKWALEAHFEPDEESKMAEKDSNDFMARFAKDPQGFADAFAKFLASQGENPEEVMKDEEEQPDIEKDYSDAVETALELLMQSDAFIVIGAKSPEPGKVIPAMFSFYKSPETGIVAEMQLSKLAAMSHQEVAIARLHDLLNGGGE